MSSLKGASLAKPRGRKKTPKTSHPLCKNEAPLGEIEPLKLEFSEKGLSYKQAKRGAAVAIYEVYNRKTKALMGYELIKPIVQPPWKIKGRAYPWREVYPRFEQFGTHGWYFSLGDDEPAASGYQRALKRFKELERHHATAS